MQELVDIRNLTLACMFLNMFSIVACVIYMLWTRQSIIAVMMAIWGNDNALIKLTEIECRKPIDAPVNTVDAAMESDPNKLYRFVDSCTGPFYDFKFKPVAELGTKPTAPTGTFRDGKPGVDAVDSSKINQSVFDDPYYSKVSDKTTAEVARPKMEI